LVSSAAVNEGTEFSRFAGEVERISAQSDLAANQAGLSLAANREEYSDFIIDLVYPVSESDTLNRLANRVVSSSIREFTSLNSGGRLYARPSAFVYGEHILGLVLDIRSYGDMQGFAARRHITIFDLNENSEISVHELFENEADFRLIFSEAFDLTLTGYEDFTFDDTYVYMHVRTHENIGINGSYTVLALPLSYFDDIWLGSPGFSQDCVQSAQGLHEGTTARA
jgi:hypothetical protein